VGQTLVTYNPALEQLLVIFPGIIAAQQSFGLPGNNPTGWPMGDFALTLNDPPPCAVGFLPPSQWRNPEDMTTVDTPDGLYCKLPQDSPMNVRGARNYPCLEHPGKRAPTVELCNDPRGYLPTALRQHSLGPYPFDPNLAAQGIAPDERVDFQERIYAPLQGTPLPPGAVPSGTPPGVPSGPAPGAVPQGPPPPAPVAAPVAPPPPPGNSINGTPIPPPPGDVPDGGGAVPAAPSAFGANGSENGPSVAFVPYDPGSGEYVAPDGQLHKQTNLAPGAAPKSWKDLMPT
jgi:phospholipid/cholesterol/gamma-HCH transport system substrate-binding protein